MQKEPLSPKFKLSIVIGIVGLYLVLSIASSITKRPWSDEGWFANPGVNLATKGYLGTNVISSASNPWLKGIEYHTYWTVPLHLVTQAAWYKVFGFSLFTLRSLSTVFGLIGLVSWFFIVRELSGDERIAFLTSFLLAIDYNFVMSSSFGRMDMMCAALGSAALASYLLLRQSHLGWAMFVANALVAASGMTHHLGILWLAGLIFLILKFDRKNIKLRHLGIACIPYVVGGLAWGAYIMESPSLFISQFTNNATTDNRLGGLTAPWTGFAREITQRYFVSFGLGPAAGGAVRLKAVILLAYLLGIVGVLSSRTLRRHSGYRVLLVLMTIYFVILSLWDGQKLSWYLVHIIPMYTAILSIWLYHLWKTKAVPRWLLIAGVLPLVLVQVGGIAQRARLNTYRNSYMPAVSFLKQNTNGHTSIIGSAELGFGLGTFDGLTDDSRLGYLSGQKPDFIVVEEIYRSEFDGLRARRPEVSAFITNRLSQEYRPVYDHEFYQIYARR